MGYELPPDRPARRPRRMRGALSLAGVGLFVCCVGAAGLGAWNFQQLRQSSSGARTAAEAFLNDVASADAPGAYDKLCGDTRERWSRDAFAQRLSVPGSITRYTIDDVAVATDRGQARGTVTATLTRRSGATDRREIPMVKDGDRWRVCGDPF